MDGREDGAWSIIEHHVKEDAIAAGSIDTASEGELALGGTGDWLAQDGSESVDQVVQPDFDVADKVVRVNNIFVPKVNSDSLENHVIQLWFDNDK